MMDKAIVVPEQSLANSDIPGCLRRAFRCAGCSLDRQARPML